MKLNDALVVALKNGGARYFFGVSGANIEHVHDAIHRLGENQLISVLAKNESGAAFMADAYARVCGRLGVCGATSGGGMLNLAVGVAEAYAESVPLLALVGQPPLSLEGKGAFQDSSGKGHSIKGMALWQSISKYVARLTHPSLFWNILQDAFSFALSGRPGPSVLLIPRDQYEAEVPQPPPQFMERWRERLFYHPPAVARQDLDSLLEPLKAAKNPVLIWGQGIRRSGGIKAGLEFALKTGIAVATTHSSCADFPHDADNYLGQVGVAGHPSVHDFIEKEADLILVIGSGLSLMNRGPIGPFLEKKTTFFINVDCSSLKETFKSAHFIEADAGASFTLLVKEMDLWGKKWVRVPYTRTFFRPVLAPAIKDKKIKVARGKKSSLLQSKALSVIEPFLPKEANVIFDAGNCAAAALHYLHAPADSTSTIALGMGGMGYGIAAAVGAHLARPSSPTTIVFAGDSAFLMAGFEIHTAVDLKLPILFIIFNNSMSGMCVIRQQLFFEGRIECARYCPVNIMKIAQGFGSPSQIWTARVKNLKELDEKLVDYQKNSHLPGVLELCLGLEEIPPFSPFLPKVAEVISWHGSLAASLEKS